jgi:hypothetical protein
MKLYAEISKTEAMDDGTIKVWGYASSEAVDSDGETITADAMKAALPDYLKFGAVREMHGSNAAGTAIEASVGDDGRTFFGAHVVDPVAVKKVNAGVYKGFSIGGKITGRDNVNKTIITGLKLVEVSLVDRPANPDSVFTMFKAEMTNGDVVEPVEVSAIDEIAEMLNKGEISAERLLELAKKKDTSAEDAQAVADAASDAANNSSKAADKASDKADASDDKGDDDAAADAHQAAAEAHSKAAQLATSKQKQRMHQRKAQSHSSQTWSHKGESVGDLVKAEELTKAAGDLDLAKAEITKIVSERDELTKRVKELEAMPAPGKALLKAVSVSKAQDNAEHIETAEPTEVRKADGTLDAEKTATLLIKQAHKSPMRLSI